MVTLSWDSNRWFALLFQLSNPISLDLIKLVLLWAVWRSISSNLASILHCRFRVPLVLLLHPFQPFLYSFMTHLLKYQGPPHMARFQREQQQPKHRTPTQPTKKRIYIYTKKHFQYHNSRCLDPSTKAQTWIVNTLCLLQKPVTLCKRPQERQFSWSTRQGCQNRNYECVQGP